jgi:hypothetical protein
MLALRKAQTNKLIEAEILLELGIRKMLSQEVVEFNATNDLINALIELYEGNKLLWQKEKARRSRSIKMNFTSCSQKRRTRKMWSIF